MSQSSRKSSTGGARRAPQRAHVPFRGDDLKHGKKTGINVDYVEHKSDDFEPFDKLLKQADGVTPPHVRNRKRAKRIPSLDANDDEDGEMSMELDDTTPNSPHAYFNNAPRPAVPSTVNRSGASSRYAGHKSDVDFDRVPSPRPSASSSTRRSQLNGNSSPTYRSRSRLSVSIRAREPDEGHLDDIGAAGGDDDASMLGGDDYDPPPGSSSPIRHTSFTQLDQDDDEEEAENENQPVSPPRKKDKGKGREKPIREEELEEDNEIEDEIAQSLVDEEMNYDDDDKGEEVESPKPVKKQAAKRQRMKQVEMTHSDAEGDTAGIRRGSRKRYKPLEWWRLEKVVYGRRESGISMVPVIKDIVRLPKEEPEPLGTLGKRKRRSAPKSKTVEEVIVSNPEEGWDDETDPAGIVQDYVTHAEVQRRVAFTAKMLTPKAAANNEFFFQKIFGDGEFIAAGQLIIPPGGKKPSKGTKDNTYVFYLIEGAVNLKVHRTSFILATGGMFLIPRGNTYYIENISQRNAKLFFAQARKIPMGEEEVLLAEKQTSLSGGRKSADPALRRRSSGLGSGGPKSPGTIVARSSSLAAPPHTSKAAPNGKVSTAQGKRAVSK